MKIEGLKDAEARSGGLLPAGWHTVVVVDATETESKQGNPQIELQLDGENHPGGIRDWQTVTPKTLGRIRQMIDSMGIEPTDDLDIASMVDKRVDVFVEEEPDRQNEGQTRPRVVAYRPAGEQGGADGDPDAGLPF